MSENIIEIEIGKTLRERGIYLATAESCTGGMIGQRITAVAGSSDYYLGGIIAYSNNIKMALLGVDAALLAEHGAVSASVAESMAQGAIQKFGADLAIATTGIAGPGGGTDTKPVGLVYIGLSAKNGTSTIQECHFAGNRKEVRMAASQTALEMIQRYLDL